MEGADSGDSSLVYMCSALSREDGTFVFPSLASGEYTVVRFLKAVPHFPTSLKVALTYSFMVTCGYCGDSECDRTLQKTLLER